jgi:molybdopterin-guanine dinucleotide biosynthesis protein A
MKISGIILAGGRSSRMGQDKTLMSVQAETLIERTVRELGQVAAEIIIASNQNSKYNLPGTMEVPDIFPGKGPLGGIHAGLCAARHPYSFVVAGDMPFFSAELARFLISKISNTYDVIAPEVGGAWEPLCAVYSKTCLRSIEQSLMDDIRNVYGLYKSVKVLKVSEHELSFLGESEDVFYNLNTPKDYQAILMREKLINVSHSNGN